MWECCDDKFNSWTLTLTHVSCVVLLTDWSEYTIVKHPNDKDEELKA